MSWYENPLSTFNMVIVGLVASRSQFLVELESNMRVSLGPGATPAGEPPLVVDQLAPDEKEVSVPPTQYKVVTLNPSHSITGAS